MLWTPANQTRNAAESVFGWHFQICSAIALMLRSLQDSVSIDVEGQKEDIEILQKDGKKIYVQVKSMYEPIAPPVSDRVARNRYNTKAYSHFRKALSGLTNTYNGLSPEKKSLCKKLVYMSNIEFPFGTIGNNHAWRDYLELPYSELEQQERQSLKSHMLQDLNAIKALLTFSVLECKPSNKVENQRSTLIREIRKFLDKLCIPDFHAEDYCDKIFCLCEHCACKKHFSLKKDVFLSAGIQMKMKYSEELYSSLLGDEEIESQDLERRYKRSIDSFVYRFNVYSSIVGEFADFCKKQGSTIVNYKEKKKSFAYQRAGEFAAQYLQDVEEMYRHSLAVYIIMKIIETRQCISEANKLFY